MRNALPSACAAGAACIVPDPPVLDSFGPDSFGPDSAEGFCDPDVRSEPLIAALPSCLRIYAAATSDRFELVWLDLVRRGRNRSRNLRAWPPGSRSLMRMCALE